MAILRCVKAIYSDSKRHGTLQMGGGGGGGGGHSMYNAEILQAHCQEQPLG